MKESPISRKTLDMLHENGYSLSTSENLVYFKRSSDNMAIVVLAIILLFASIPVFAAGVTYGVFLICIVASAVFVRRMFFSKQSSFVIDVLSNTFSIKAGNFFIENQSLKMIDTISIDSRYLGEYTTATRSHQEEHLISFKLKLITKETIPLFLLKSEQSKPSVEMTEVFNYLESTLKLEKAA